MDAEHLIDVEAYFVEFAKMRKDREEREKVERQKQKEEELKRQKELEEEIKKQKELEAEMEKKRKSIEIQPSKAETDTVSVATTSIAHYASANNIDLDSNKSPRHIRDRTASKDFGTINRYGKKKRRRSKTKFKRSKVAAMIAGFEQIEKKVKFCLYII